MWEGQIKKGHMATPINHQTSNRLESIPNHIMDLEGAFLELERALLPSLPKSGGHGPSGLPGPYVPGRRTTPPLLADSS